mgnify:CR=1 FL=1|tara:strand:- start:281 stop:769 length:489 start_codon:yes stop_codon:yes gene_type:complete
MSQLAKIDYDIYIPVFDENTGEYIDKSPYKPYERNRVRFECRCCAGKSFATNAQFKSHIKSQTHQEFIKNYSKYYKEVDNASETIKNQLIENELLKRKNRKITKQYIILKSKDIDNNELLELNNKLLEKDKRIKELEKYIESLDNFDSEEEFSECNSECNSE